ncbi:RIP metalloprotease [Candidatus Uhrbacteria bacterium]|nr:MAG: RIP metalloprotease [Candidatus Uhrbacteria bacterium]
MFSVIAFLVILSGLVLLHELGHFLVARLLGVKADEFGFGFPPRAIGFVKDEGKWKRVGRTDRTRYKNTVWSLNWLPLGGFVRLKGEMPEDAQDADSLLAKNGWQKFAILAAGVTMNWLTAAVIFTLGFSIGVPAVLDGLPDRAVVSDTKVQIMDVVTGTAADKAGLKPGDALVSIDGIDIPDADTARLQLNARGIEEAELTLVLDRRGERIDVVSRPEYLEQLNRAALGIALADTGTVRFPVWLAIGEGVTLTARYTWMIIAGFGQLILGLFNGKTSAELSGPVGIAVMTGGIVQQGAWAAAQFAAILSLNLAVINFLPIPALDGGRAVFVVLEGIRRKKNNMRTEAIVHQIGFITLMLLVLLVTIQDLRRYGATIWQGLLGLFGG